MYFQETGPGSNLNRGNEGCLRPALFREDLHTHTRTLNFSVQLACLWKEFVFSPVIEKTAFLARLVVPLLWNVPWHWNGLHLLYLVSPSDEGISPKYVAARRALCLASP